MIHLRTNKPVSPKVPFETELVSRQPLPAARLLPPWMTSPQNDYLP